MSKARWRQRCLFSIRARQMIGKTGGFRGKGSGHPWVSLLLFAIWWEITFCSSLACTGKQNKNSAVLQNPIVDANSEVRLNTNLQEDYPKKLFLFMQFVLRYLACHLDFVTTLQNVRVCRKTNMSSCSCSALPFGQLNILQCRVSMESQLNYSSWDKIREGSRKNCPIKETFFPV